MSTGRLIFFLLSVAIVLPILSVSLTRAATDEGGEDSLSKHLSVFSEVLSLIRRAYVEETSVDELLAGALDGSTDALDPLATFVPAAEVEGFQDARRVGRSHSGLTVAKERGITFVLAVDPESPAMQAGLEHGDIIAKVAGRSTRKMPLWQLQKILADEPGTRLEFEILRRAQSEQITLTLGDYETAPPALREVQGAAVLRLGRFDGDDLAPMREILAGLTAAGREKLLVDLRGVAGGESEAAYALAGLFVSGRLGELRARDEATLLFEGRETPLWSGETVILVDGATQGAAEIFATVLRQGAGSRLVGRRSFGHAGRQRMIPLSTGAQLLLTDAFYSGPDGEPILRGLSPDETVNELSRRFSDQDETLEDLTLERGLELLAEEETVEEVA